MWHSRMWSHIFSNEMLCRCLNRYYWASNCVIDLEDELTELMAQCGLEFGDNCHLRFSKISLEDLYVVEDILPEGWNALI